MEWTLEMLTTAVYDYERAQYQILANLQEVRKKFAENRIYPYLGELINFYGTMQTILQNAESLKDALPGKIKEIDLENQQVIYEKPELDDADMLVIEELMGWALPSIKDTIDEGKVIYEFVEENLFMEEVGIIPQYVQEGYLFVPDRAREELNILQYNLSIFVGVQERFRSLRTSHVKSVEAKLVAPDPSTLKLMLLEERWEMPNPATYSFSSDLDFPYEATMLPVAKRRLMRHLFD